LEKLEKSHFPRKCREQKNYIFRRLVETWLPSIRKTFVKHSKFTCFKSEKILDYFEIFLQKTLRRFFIKRFSNIKLSLEHHHFVVSRNVKNMKKNYWKSPAFIADIFWKPQKHKTFNFAKSFFEFQSYKKLLLIQRKFSSCQKWKLLLSLKHISVHTHGWINIFILDNFISIFSRFTERRKFLFFACKIAAFYQSTELSCDYERLFRECSKNMFKKFV
jgi:hypothetical protein